MKSLALRLNEGDVLLPRLLAEGVDIAHDCGGVLACSSCRVVVREGLESFSPATEEELDLLDRVGAAVPGGRLACQVSGAGELLIEIPYSEAPVQVVDLSVRVSDRAARHLAAQLARHAGAVAVRVAAVPAGCSGFRYRVDPVDALRDGDRVFDNGVVQIVVDAASLPYLQGTMLDVVEEGLARRLRFDNPNARQNCGCGESFGV